MTLEWTPASDGDPTFEVTSARQHNTLAGRSTAGAHPASALSYDNATSGLTADTVQEAIDEVAASGGGGAVDSVNGETGVVVLDAQDVGAAPTTRTITAGTGLTGGGTLAADRTLSADLSSSAGAALGVAAPGVATTIARSDHVHPMPTASDVGGVPETLIDAAGDLIVGTAADTAGRLALGAAGTVLTSNGTTATWAAPSGTGLMQSVPWGTGAVYALPIRSTPNTLAAMSLGVMTTHPIWLPAGNYAGLSVQSTAAAVSTWRLGIYNGGPYTPGTLLHDCGTINMNATPGSLLASSAFTVPTTGIYWVGVLVDAYTAAPTVYAMPGLAEAGVLPWLGAQQLNATGGGRHRVAVRTTGVTTGAMPATAPTGSTNDTAPLIRAHAA